MVRVIAVGKYVRGNLVFLKFISWDVIRHEN